MNYDLYCLYYITAGTFLIGTFGVMLLRDKSHRLLLASILVGIFFYNGIGAAETEVNSSFVVYYFIFFIATIAGFYLVLPLNTPSRLTDQSRLSKMIDVDRDRVWGWIIVVYVLISMFPLVWPENKLINLINPQPPNLSDLIGIHSETQDIDVLIRLAGYVQMLITPFFYIAIYRLRQKLYLLYALFTLLMYIEYVDKFYIGRGNMMIHYAILVLATWVLRPEYRRRMVISCAIVFPLLIYFFYIYSVIRIGGTVEQVGFTDAIGIIFGLEVNFPQYAGMPLINSLQHVDIASYLTWIFTLPIPKLLTGPIKVPEINFDISELVLGIPRGNPGYFVVLPGLVAESVYIFGRDLFWLHGIFIGALAGLMTRIMGRTPQLLFLRLYLVTLFGYILNRAGITAFLPLLINQFLLFYIFAYTRSRATLPHSHV